MKIATLTESSENENRVAITPDSAKFLIKFGHEVIIQSGAGKKARFSDNDYKKSGCKILLHPVKKPELYGVAHLGKNNKVKSLKEKPKNSKSNLAVTGLAIFQVI